MLYAYYKKLLLVENKKIYWCSAPTELEQTPSGDNDFIVQIMASLQNTMLKQNG